MFYVGFMSKTLQL